MALGGNAEVESLSPSQTATLQISQIIVISLWSVRGCSADRIDEVLAPYAEENTKTQMPKSECFLKSKRTMLGQDSKRSMMPQSLEYGPQPLTSNGQTPLYFAGLWSWNQSLRTGNPKAILEIRIRVLDRNTSGPLSFKRSLPLSGAQPRTWNAQLWYQAIGWNVRRSACIRTFRLMTRLSSWRAHFKVPMGCRSFLQGWRMRNGVEVEWPNEPRGWRRDPIYLQFALGIWRRQGRNS